MGPRVPWPSHSKLDFVLPLRCSSPGSGGDLTGGCRFYVSAHGLDSVLLVFLKISVGLRYGAMIIHWDASSRLLALRLLSFDCIGVSQRTRPPKQAIRR